MEWWNTDTCVMNRPVLFLFSFTLNLWSRFYSDIMTYFSLFCETHTIVYTVTWHHSSWTFSIGTIFSLHSRDLWVLIWTSISRDLLDLKSLALSYCLLALAIHLLSALHHWTLSLWLAQVLSLVGLGWCINAQLEPLGIKTQSCTLSQWSFWL